MQVLGCAMLLPLGNTVDGTSVAELGAFCVDPIFRYGILQGLLALLVIDHPMLTMDHYDHDMQGQRSRRQHAGLCGAGGPEPGCSPIGVAHHAHGRLVRAARFCVQRSGLLLPVAAGGQEGQDQPGQE